MKLRRNDCSIDGQHGNNPIGILNLNFTNPINKKVSFMNNRT